MTEFAPTCVGYARFRAGIDSVEQYTSPSSVEETLCDFEPAKNFIDAQVLAIISGSKHLKPAEKLKQRVKHMAYIEDTNGNCTHRNGVGAEIESTTIKQLLDEYVDDRDIYYAMYLMVKKPQF